MAKQEDSKRGYLLGRLRNQWGGSEYALREVRLTAANELERLWALEDTTAEKTVITKRTDINAQLALLETDQPDTWFASVKVGETEALIKLTHYDLGRLDQAIRSSLERP